MTPDITQKITSFFTAFPRQEFSKGSMLVFAGDEPAGVWYIQSGQVRQYDIAPNGDEVVLNIFKSPAFFPMSWAINKTPNRYFYDALTDVVLYRAPAADAVTFLRENPDVTFDLLARVYKGTDGLLGRMSLMMQNSARKRILFELIIACERAENSHEPQLHETQLASRVGLTRETVNREIRKLKTEGLVEVTQAGISVPDVAALKTQLGMHEV